MKRIITKILIVLLKLISSALSKWISTWSIELEDSLIGDETFSFIQDHTNLSITKKVKRRKHDK